jgi:ribonuclease R
VWIEDLGIPSLYRIHEKPEPRRVVQFEELAASFGFSLGLGPLPVKRMQVRAERREFHGRGRNPRQHEVPEDIAVTPRMYQELAARIEGKPEERILSYLMLRSLSQARYSEVNEGHFALAAPTYTHFTSPIRRYSDLVVHRVFDAYLVKHAGHPAPGGRIPGYDLRGVAGLAEHLSLTEQNSTEAERESVKIKILEFFERELEKKPPTRFAAVITDVRRQGLFIELVESMTFGFISADAFTDDRYSLNEAGNALVGRRKRQVLQIGGRFDVFVDKVDRFRRTIDFRPAGVTSSGVASSGAPA